MRLLFLTQTYPRFEGDTAGPFIRDLARGLVAAGDEVTVLAPHAPEVPDRWVEAGVEALSFRYAPERLEVLGYSRSLSSDEAIRWQAGMVTPLYLLAAGRRLRRLLRERSFDLVHGHWVVPNGWLAAFASSGVPSAVGLHGSDVFLAEKPLVRSLVKAALKRTRLLTGCSPELVERVCALGFDRRKARVIPYGVNTTQFSPAPDLGRPWRQQLQIPDSAVLILAVGRMVTKKGFHVLLDAVPDLLREHPEAHFVLAGEGDRRQEFQARISSERVSFPGVVLRDSLPSLYRAADIFVLPAVHDTKGNVDGLPNVILEAMATGLPVVASAVSGIPLAVTDGKEGLLVEEQDSASLVRALSELLSNQELRRRMGREARLKAETDLTWTAVSACYRSAYEEALSGFRGRRPTHPHVKP